MMFQEEQAEMDKSFLDLLSRILPKISAKSSGNDCVLDDEDDEFKKYFLSIAANKFLNAYHSYLFDARVKRNQNTRLTKLNAIKIKVMDSDASSENTDTLADQVTTITQLNCNESECDASRAIETSQITRINAAPITVVPNEKSVNAQQEPPKKGDLLFYCPHRHDENSTNTPYANAESIYKHRVTKHVQSQKPFQFNVGSLFVCDLCIKSETFPELKYHFKIKHHGKQFAVKDQWNEGKCGICEFIGNDLAEHFESKHRFLTDSKILCPMRLAQDVQDNLKRK